MGGCDWRERRRSQPEYPHQWRFRHQKRGTTYTSATIPANSDDTYLLDRWVILSDGNDICDFSQESGSAALPVGSRAALKADIETEDKKWGILQIVGSVDSREIIGGSCSLSFKAARGAGDTSTLLRAGVLSWSGTADTVTSDVVDAWGDEGTNPTLVASWTYENTPAALTELTDAWQTFEIANIAIDTANTTNVAVFIWSDDKTNAVGDLVHITDVKLEKGATCTDYIHKSKQEEEDICNKFCRTWGINAARFGTGRTVSTAYAEMNLPNIDMRSTPAISVIGSGYLNVNDGSVNVQVTEVGQTNNTSSGAVYTNVIQVGGTTLTAWRPVFFAMSSADTQFMAQAEL
jgi:hypothetical protein